MRQNFRVATSLMAIHSMALSVPPLFNGVDSSGKLSYLSKSKKTRSLCNLKGVEKCLELAKY